MFIKKVLTLCVLLSYLGICFACDDDDKSSKKLKNTQWELTGMIDLKTGEKITPEPKNCKNEDPCFYMTIDGEGMAHLHLEFATFDFHLTDAKVFDACQKIYYEYTGNADLFQKALCLSLNDIHHDEGALKLFCNDNKSYLIFKKIEK